MKRASHAAATLALVLACCSCGSHSDDDDPAARADVPGCSTHIDPIAEPTAYIPYKDRLSVPVSPARLDIDPLTASDRPPSALALPARVDDRQVKGIRSLGGTVTVAYGGPDLTPATTYSGYVSAGGLVLSSWSEPDGADAVKGLLNDPGGAERITLVRVADHEAALTWADPFANGVREHNVIWTAGTTTYKVEADLPPEQILAAAREFACR